MKTKNNLTIRVVSIIMLVPIFAVSFAYITQHSNVVNILNKYHILNHNDIVTIPIMAFYTSLFFVFFCALLLPSKPLITAVMASLFMITITILDLYEMVMINDSSKYSNTPFYASIIGAVIAIALSYIIELRQVKKRKHPKNI